MAILNHRRQPRRSCGTGRRQLRHHPANHSILPPWLQNIQAFFEYLDGYLMRLARNGHTLAKFGRFRVPCRPSIFDIGPGHATLSKAGLFHLDPTARAECGWSAQLLYERCYKMLLSQVLLSCVTDQRRMLPTATGNSIFVPRKASTMSSTMSSTMTFAAKPARHSCSHAFGAGSLAGSAVYG